MGTQTLTTHISVYTKKCKIMSCKFICIMGKYMYRYFSQSGTLASEVKHACVVVTLSFASSVLRTCNLI